MHSKHNWKICLAGFISDFIGAMILFAAALMLSVSDGDGTSLIEKVADGIMFNPFTNLLSLIFVILAIAVAAVCIYFLDRGILVRTGLDPEKAGNSARRLALITAPYLYLLPSEWFYEGGILGL